MENVGDFACFSLLGRLAGGTPAPPVREIVHKLQMSTNIKYQYKYKEKTAR